MARPTACALILALVIAFTSAAPIFDRVFIIVFENQAYENVIRDPNFKLYADQGLSLTNFKAATHPSQPNYIAMVGGDTLGVIDNSPYIINKRHIGDLLEDKGFTWRTYQEGYPGNCDPTVNVGTYYRKHNPFISFYNVLGNCSRCRNTIVPAQQLDDDLANGKLATYSFYSPDIRNDGHDTGIAYAGSYLHGFMTQRLAHFPPKTLIIITWDEDDKAYNNHIYTVLLGDMVAKGTTDASDYNFYSLLRSIELNYGLCPLGTGDLTASAITAITPPNATFSTQCNHPPLDPNFPPPTSCAVNPPSAPHPPNPPSHAPEPIAPSPAGTSPVTIVVVLLVVVLVVVGVTVLSVMYRDRIRVFFASLTGSGASDAFVRPKQGAEKIFEEGDEMQVDLDDSGDELR